MSVSDRYQPKPKAQPTADRYEPSVSTPVIIPEEVSPQELRGFPEGFDITTLFRDISSLPRKTPSVRNAVINGWQFKIESYRMKKGNEWVDLWLQRISQYNQMAEAMVNSQLGMAQTMVKTQSIHNELQRERARGQFASQQIHQEYRKFFANLNAEVDRIQMQLELDKDKHISNLERQRRQAELDEEQHQTAIMREQLQRDLDRAEFEAKIEQAQHIARRAKRDKK